MVCWCFGVVWMCRDGSWMQPPPSPVPRASAAQPTTRARPASQPASSRAQSHSDHSGASPRRFRKTPSCGSCAGPRLGGSGLCSVQSVCASTSCTRLHGRDIPLLTTIPIPTTTTMTLLSTVAGFSAFGFGVRCFQLGLQKRNIFSRASTPHHTHPQPPPHLPYTSRQSTLGRAW